MKSWGAAARDAVATGTMASVLSTIALAALGRHEAGHAAAPTNATSHWVWGERAALQDRPSLRYTALGYAIHHAASIFWAVFYERWFGRNRLRREPLPTLAGAASVSALASFVDYELTPHRLRPGYEKRLSRPAVLLVYAAFAAGLALASARRR